MKLLAAYIAGVIDSDGSLTIYRQHRNRKASTYTPTFQLQWTKTTKSKKVLDSLVKQYGGSFCEPVRRSGFSNSKPTYKYCLTSMKLRQLLLDVIPHLALKRKQAINLLRLIELNAQQFGSGRAKSKALIRRQESLRKKTLKENA